jgi:hypothetical protein
LGKERLEEDACLTSHTQQSKASWQKKALWTEMLVIKQTPSLVDGGRLDGHALRGCHGCVLRAQEMEGKEVL